MSKGKPRGGRRPAPPKTPRGGQGDPFAASPFRFTVDECECDGPFGFNVLAHADLFQDVLTKMKQMETMTWEGVRAGGSHSIEVTSIIPEAVERLQAAGHPDADSVYSLRLTGRRRVFGIKDGAVFRTLWWDPEHRICPAPKRYT